MGQLCANSSALELFKELVPLLNTRGLALLENERAIGQLCALERCTGRNGNDSISHPRGGHDDLAVAIAGASWLAGTSAARRGQVMTGSIGIGGEITWRGGRDRINALSAARGGCIPSPEWSRRTS